MNRIFCLAFLLLSTFYYSQEIKFGINSIFHLSAPNSFSGTNSIIVNPSETSYSAVRGNLGAGFSLGLESSISVHENISIGIKYSEFFGATTLFYHLDDSTINYNLEASLKQSRIIPSFKFSIPCKKINFGTESGLIFPLRSYSTFEFRELDKTTNDETVKIDKYTYNYAIGFQQSINASVKIKKHFELDFALGISLFSQSLKNKNTLSYTINEQNNMENLSEYDKKTVYDVNLNNYSNNSSTNSNYDTKSPKNELIRSHNFSTIYLSFSLKYFFNKN